MEQGKHDRRSLLRQGGGRAGPDDDQQHLLGNIFSRDRRSPPQQDDNEDPEAKVDQKNDDSQFLFGEGQCVDFSGCEGDPKKQAVCRKRFLFLPQKTICVRWSSRISLLLRRGGKCGCCSVEEEPDRPEYCDALVGSDPTTAPSLSPTLMPSAPPSPVPTELTLVVNVKALFDAQQDESLSLLQKAQVIASILNATVVPNSVLYPGLFGTRPIVDLEFQVRFEDPFFDLDVFAGDATLRDSLVVSLTAGQKIIKVSNCTEQCGSAEQDVPPGYCYPPTDQCVCTGRYGGPTCSDFCFSAETDAACNAVQGCTWCNTTATCLVTQNLARTSEEVEYCAECSDFTAQERFCTAAPLCDYCPSTRTCTSNSITNGSVVCPFDVKQTSPKNGEENVALTRETVIDFSEPLDPSTVSSSTVQAAAQTGMLNTTLYLSSSGLTLTIFFQEDLPANADITIRITGGLKTMEGNALAGMYEFYFSTLSILPVAGTLVCGRVFASELSQEVAGEWLDVPLEGVTISVDGNAAINAVTQSDGTFTMNDVPAGTFFVHIDGRTSPAAVNGSYYPNVGKSWTTVAGTMNSVGTVYLPLISSSTLQELDDEETTIVEFPEEVIESDPRLEGVFLAVPPGSLIDSTGSGETPMVGIAPVDRDRLPGTLPPTLRLPLVITIQTVGGSNFDVPVPVCFPNLPDPTTNSTLEPGDTTSLWSFNHDTGRFDVVGPATVNIDGTAVCSDPGYGIVAPGWHGAAPGTPTDPPDDEPECEGDPCCESDDPCCGSDNGGGGGPGGGGPGGTGWGEAAFSAADSVFGCLKDYISKKGGETWEKGVKCGSSIYGLGKDLVGTFRSDTAPKTGQDVVDAASKIQGGKWGISKSSSIVGEAVKWQLTSFFLTLDIFHKLRSQ